MEDEKERSRPGVGMPDVLGLFGVVDMSFSIPRKVEHEIEALDLTVEEERRACQPRSRDAFPHHSNDEKTVLNVTERSILTFLRTPSCTNDDPADNRKVYV